MAFKLVIWPEKSLNTVQNKQKKSPKEHTFGCILAFQGYIMNAIEIQRL